MQIDWFTFSAQIINFLLLLWLLHRFLYGPVLKVMHRREERVASRLEEARLTLQDAEEKAREYRQKLDQFESEKETWRREARQEAEQYRKDLLQAAREEVEKMQQRWKRAIEAERDVFLDELEQRVTGQLLALVEKIVRDLANRDMERDALAWLDQQLSSLSDAEKNQIAEMAPGATPHMVAATAFPLSEEQRASVEAMVRSVFPSPASCRFTVEPELGFGVELRSEGWKLGWNMKAYTAELRERVSGVMEPSL